MIKIQVLDNKILDTSRVIDSRATRRQVYEFELYLCDIFIKEVKRCIDTQSIKWEPLSRPYLLSKVRRGLSTNIWEATSQLKNTLSVRKSTGMVLTIGWKRSEHHKGSKTPIYKIARDLEYGTMKIPPRPLFRVVFSKIERNLSRYYEEYLDSVSDRKRGK